MSDHLDKKEQMQQRHEIIKERLQKIKYKVVIMSGKGGVGKTTVAVNLAIKLAALGKTVGILDVDITGPNVPLMLNMEGMRPEINTDTKTFRPVIGPMNLRVMSMAFLLESNETPVIWRGPMKMGAIRQFLAEAEWGELDYLVFDLPPGTSDETLDIMQLIEGAGIVVVTTPQDVALLDSRKTVNMAKTMGRHMLGIVENMAGYVCPHCGESVNIFGIGGGEKAAEALKVPFLGRIPFEVDVRIHSDEGLPFIIENPNSPSALAFEKIVKKVQNVMES
ncbi:MAG: Mrp/NBP35 family ATP-binding protein [Candidatus Lokiarchaeota archaeon]|nr:Mrp/NBP35 family ATP-binding protein [Candidatus Lokiarchaeota archaeon]